MKDSIKKIGLLAGAGEVPAHFAISNEKKGICIEKLLLILILNIQKN